MNETFERVQIDLIDMRHEPDREYKWILHAKDHFSKYSGLWALKSKEAEGVAEALEGWIMSFGPPSMIQCDNGKEFKGALLILLRRHGIKVINGNPRSPQTQGLVEQGNGVVEHKIRAWKMENDSTKWRDALLEVALQINSQRHSVTGRTPYEIIFRQRFLTTTWVSSRDRQVQQVPNEDGISYAEPELESSTINACTSYVTGQNPSSTRVSSLLQQPAPHLIGATLHGSCHRFSTQTENILAELRTKNPRVEPTDEELEQEANGGPASEPESDTRETFVDSEEERLVEHELRNLRNTRGAAEPLWVEEGIRLPCRSAPISTQANSDLVVLEDVRQKHIKNREYMSRKYNKKWTIDEFKKGDIVALKIPREVRSSTDNLRLFCMVIDRPHRNSYELRCRHGILNRKYPTKSLERVPTSLTRTIEISTSLTKKISLAKAAGLESTSTRVQVSCQYKGQCGK